MVGIFGGWGFCPAELTVTIYQAKPNRFLDVQLKRLFIGNERLKILNRFLVHAHFMLFLFTCDSRIANMWNIFRIIFNHKYIIFLVFTRENKKNNVK